MYIIILQVDGTGNCLFASLKKSLSVHTATSQQATYFPNRYFRRMVVCFMANHCQLMIKNKYLSLMSNYGVEVEAGQVRGWTPPLSFKQYLHLLLRRDFWGDEAVLFAVSCMWSARITVLNTKTLQEYRIHGMIEEWRRWMWWSHIMAVTILMQQVSSAIFKMTHMTTHSYCLENTSEQPNDPH